MMVSEPEKVRIIFVNTCSKSLFFSLSLKWVDEMADAGANQYTFHLEATGKITNRGLPI